MISSILNSSRSISPQILEEHGISSIDLVEPDFDDQDSDSGSTSAEVVKRLSTLPEDEVERPGTANSAGFISVFTPTTSTPDKSQTRYHSFSPERTAHMDPTIGVTNSSSDFSRYQRLLERVVDAARDVDLNNLCSMSILLEIEASFGFSYLPKDERNKMIGAAGELCVGPPYALSNEMFVNVLTRGRFSKGSRHLARHCLISRWRIGRAQSDTTSALTQIIETFINGMGLKGPILCTMISRALSPNSSSTKVS